MAKNAPLFPFIPRNGGVFLGSLFFAFLLWLLFYFSRDFSIKTGLSLLIVQKENQKEIPLPIKIFWVKIRGNGLSLTQYIRKQDKSPIRISGNFKFRNSIHLHPYFQEINAQMPSGIQVEEILTDSIPLQRIYPLAKKVPLQIGFQASFQKQFYYSNPARMYPDSVLIRGPKALVAGIRSWKLPNILLNNVNKSIDTSIVLSDKHLPEIRLEPDHARIKINVDRFTENIISLPIKIQNNEEGNSITLIPSRIEITYLVPLSYYSTVKEDLFEARVNLNDWKKNPGIGKLKVEINRSPDFIRIIKKKPGFVDFLIYK